MAHMARDIGNGRRAAAICHKFPTYSTGVGTLFDFVVVYSGSKLRPAGDVCCLRLSCFVLYAELITV